MAPKKQPRRNSRLAKSKERVGWMDLPEEVQRPIFDEIVRGLEQEDKLSNAVTKVG